jgi:hypothetical protein
LLDALCEETISPDQVARLEELVLAHPELEACYVQYLSLHAELAGRFGAVPAQTEQSLARQAGEPADAGGTVPTLPMPEMPRLRRPRLLLWGAVGLASAAAAVILVLALGGRPSSRQGGGPGTTEATDNTVAVLVQAPGAVWGECDSPTRIGARLRSGWLRLKSGLAHIEFYSGATVVVEGPAELRLISRTEAYCARGKLRATVPAPAQGFAIGTPKLDLIDRGTEFGLAVEADKQTEVHVFQGKVDLYAPGVDQAAPPRELTKGHSIRVEEANVLQPIAPNPTAFRTTQDLDAESAKALLLRQQEWDQECAKLRRDPGLRVWYTFQPAVPGSRTLRDQAGDPLIGEARNELPQRNKLSRHDGTIVGCSWAAGRWPGRHGLDFRKVSDRVRLHVPGEFDALTLAAWVRVDALPNLNNSLMMADGWEPGGPHWQLVNPGMLTLGVQSQPKKRGAHYDAPDQLTPDHLGNWIHLAVTYDPERGEVTHYIDGRPVSRLAIEFEIPLRIGDAELGNWNMASHRNKTPIRHFTGCMDEFMLFARALTDPEIETLYTRGQPPF